VLIVNRYAEFDPYLDNRWSWLFIRIPPSRMHAIRLGDRQEVFLLDRKHRYPQFM
jgi:hypothetical protein